MKGLILIVGVIFMTQLDLPMVEGLSCLKCTMLEPGCSEVGVGASAGTAKPECTGTTCKTTILPGGLAFERGCGEVNRTNAGCADVDAEKGQDCYCLAPDCNFKDTTDGYIGGDGGPGKDKVENTTIAKGDVSTGTAIGSTPMLILLGVVGIPVKFHL